MFENLKSTWKTSYPLILGAIVFSSLGIIDGIFLANYSQVAFNATIIATPLINLVICIGTGLGVAVTNVISRNNEQLKSIYYIIIIIILSVLISLIVIVSFYISSEKLFERLGYNLNAFPLLRKSVSDFWLWLIPSFFNLILLLIIIQLCVYYGKNKLANTGLFIIFIFNLILNPICIFFLNLGIKGSAVSTNISLISGVCFFVFHYYKKFKVNVFLISKKILLQRSGAITIRLLYDFLIIFASTIVFIIGGFLVNKTAYRLGQEAFVITGLIETIKSFFVLPTRAVTGAYIIEFNKKLKEKKYSEYFPAYWAATLLQGIIYSAGVILFLFFGSAIKIIYNLNKSAFSISEETLKYCFHNSAFLLIIFTFMRNLQLSFLCINRNIYVFTFSVFNVTTFYLLSNYLSSEYGVKGLFDGLLLGNFITLLVFFLLFYLLIKKRIEQDKLETSYALF